MQQKMLEDVSLKLIVTTRTLKDVTLLDNMLRVDKPSMFIDNLEEFEKKLRNYESCIMVLPSLLSSFKSLTLNAMEEMKKTRENMIARISERKEKGIPMNTSVEFYDETRLLTDIMVHGDTEPSIDTLHIDPIIDPSKYSTMSVINSLDVCDVTLNMISSAIQYYVNSNNNINSVIDTKKKIFLDIREIINGSNFLIAMATDVWSTDAVEYRKRIVADLNAILSGIFTIEKDVMKIFQMFMALQTNFEIYSDAVDSCTKIVLESFFNRDTVIEIL